MLAQMRWHWPSTQPRTSRSQTTSLPIQSLHLHNSLIFAIFILRPFFFHIHLQSWTPLCRKQGEKLFYQTTESHQQNNVQCKCALGSSHNELWSKPTFWAHRSKCIGKGRITGTTTSHSSHSCHRDRSASRGILILNTHWNPFEPVSLWASVLVIHL